MPIPKPKPSEKQSDFILRCVPELSKYHSKDQAVAMCYKAYKDKKWKIY